MTLDQAQRLVKSLESLDGDFRTLHYSVVDLITMREQDTLNQHDDTVEEFTVCLKRLITACSNLFKDPSAPRNISLEETWMPGKGSNYNQTINLAIGSLDSGTDHTCRL